MKRIISLLLSACLFLSLLGCQVAEPTTSTQDTNGDSSTTITTVDVPFTAVSVPAITETVTAEDGTVIFTKSYQSMALTLSGQATADKVVIDFLNRVDTACSSTDSIAESAKKAYTASGNWIPYTCAVSYNPTRIDQGVLSLFGTAVSYSGGSHPDRRCVAANYDLISGDTLTLGSILTLKDKTQQLSELVIQALEPQKSEKYLFGDFAQQVTQRFAGDISYDSDWYFSQKGLCFYFAPYEIAPYSSGVIIAEIPYESLVGVITDEFFPPEHQHLTGSVEIVQFDPATSQYANISELILDNDGEKYALQSNSCVQDLRVTVHNSENSSYVAYAALFLNPGDAVVIQCAVESLSSMEVQYYSNGQITTQKLGATE